MTDAPALERLVCTISIHMPHTWHDRTRKAGNEENVVFQSTCHIRGMTQRKDATIYFSNDFNPHATYVA